jgi:hypothetical protein
MAVAAALVSGAVSGQEPIQATIDRPVIRDNESFTYVLRAEGPVRGEPEDAPLQGQFDVINRSSNRRVGIVNGRTSEVSEWQYQLMPKAAGDFTIPALRVGDRRSNPVTVRVLPPDSNPGPAADIFMELLAEPDNVYVQSQLLVTVRLFVGVSTGRATLTAPETSGVEAIVEKLGEDASYQTTRGGRDFIVRERRYAVFPQEAGALTVGPVTFEAMVIPDRGFSRVQRFRSDVLALDIQPAVPPPPELSGAAWLPARRVTLTEQWSEPGDELAVGVPRTRAVVVEGLGLLETQLPDVPIEQQRGIRQYADQPELSREATPEGFLSRRRVSLAVIAQTDGELALRPVRLPWWNVSAERWEVAELPERTLRIAPAEETPAIEPVPVEAAGGASVAAPAASSYWPVVSALLGLAWLMTVGLWWRARAGRTAKRPPATSEPAGGARKPALRKIVRDLAAACAVHDAAAARRALLLYGETRFTESPPRSLGALAAALPEDSGREVLSLEAHIYGAAAGEWRGDGLKAVLPELERAGEPSDEGPVDPLRPLYR